MEIKDRIKKLVRVRAGTIRPCPWNWRTHNKDQREALAGVLQEIGIAGAVIVRELEDGTYGLIDGHLRQEEYPAEQKVPALVLDVTEDEAKKLLASYDPLGGMAGVDKEKLQGLLKQIDTGNSALASLFSKIAGDSLNPEDLQLNVGDDGSEIPVIPTEAQPSHVRMVQLFLNTKTLPLLEEMATALGQKYGTTTLTDTIMECLRRAYEKKKKAVEAA